MIFQDAEGRLRVNVIQGTNLSKTLLPGQMNYLTAVEQIRLAQYNGKAIDTDSAALIGVYFGFYSGPDTFPEINYSEPWLFAKALGTQEEQRTFYRKVWKLYGYINHPIQPRCLGIPVMLRRVTPDFLTLRVTLIVCKTELGESGLFSPIDEEGEFYTLSTEWLQNGIGTVVMGLRPGVDQLPLDTTSVSYLDVDRRVWTKMATQTRDKIGSGWILA